MNAELAMMAAPPRWAVMWFLAVAMFAAGKAVMLRRAGLRGWRFAGFAFGWVGMDPEPFREKASGSHRVPAGAWHRWLVNTFVGCILLWGAARIFTNPLLAGWTGMVGLILFLHFGIFGLLAQAWRAAGIPVTPIMCRPTAATSLSEFWGRRWNLPFRDLTHRVVFTPASRRWGHKAALWLAFAASGVAHEIVISVPAGAGFGLPTAYFLMQAFGIALERRADRDASGRWLRTHLFTVVPAGMLFHPPFVERVMVPFFHAIGALP